MENLIHYHHWFPKYEIDLIEQIHFDLFNNHQKGFNQLKEKEEKSKLSEQILDVRQNRNETLVNLSERQEINYEQRLERIEKSHERILSLIEQLKQRVDQIEFNKNSVRKNEIDQENIEILSTRKNNETKNDDDIDLFGSDDEEENEETKKRLAEYAAKKSKKEQVIAKSTIVLDVKPWDDETDINAMEKAVRSIEADGLVWGQSKQLPVAFGVKKLQIGCVVEDDKIGTDFLEEKICEFENYVQSVDIVSFNKI